MKLNKQWHLAHPMPKNPTLEQRIAWHTQHAAHCQCREMPSGIKAAIANRKTKINKS